MFMNLLVSNVIPTLKLESSAWFFSFFFYFFFFLSSVPMEDLDTSSGHKARVSVSGDCKVPSLLTKSSQSTSVKETVRKLTSNLW